MNDKLIDVLFGKDTPRWRRCEDLFQKKLKLGRDRDIPQTSRALIAKAYTSEGAETV